MLRFQLSLALGLFLIVPALFAASPGYPSASVTWGPTFESGQSQEIIYAGTGSTTKLSELKWPIPLTLGVSVAVDIDWASWLTTKLELAGGVPLQTGTMTDDDWNVYDTNGSLLTRIHSDSTAYQTANWSARFEAAVPFHASPVSWSLVAGVLYHHLAWEAWNPTQTATYAVNGSQSTQTWTGLALILRQDWLMPYVGAAAGIHFYGADWKLGLRTTPLVQNTQSDSHVLRGLNFNESLSLGWLIEPEASMEWPLFPHWLGIIKVNFQEIFGLRGAETVSYDGASPTGSAPFTSFTDSAGAGLQTLKISFLVRTDWGEPQK